MSTVSGSFKPRCVADALGLGTLADEAVGLDPELLRQLYRHARNEDGKRVLFENDPTFAKGWVNLDAAGAHALVAVFVPLDQEDDLKKARRMAQTNLEAQPWNDLLGFDSPPVKCVVKIHGSKWGLRFQSYPAIRGREVVNEDLPPAPECASSDTGRRADPPPVHPATASAAAAADTGLVSAPSSAAAPSANAGGALRSAGMPT